jgi:hypothetical protein
MECLEVVGWIGARAVIKEDSTNKEEEKGQEPGRLASKNSTHLRSLFEVDNSINKPFRKAKLNPWIHPD